MKCWPRSITSLAEAALVVTVMANAASAGPAVPGVAVRDAIIEAVRGRMGAEAVVGVHRLWLPAAGPEPAVTWATPEPGARVGPAMRFALAVNGTDADSSRSGYAVVSLTLAVDHTRVKRSIRRGSTITADDVAPSQEEVRDVWLKRLPLPGEVVGARATRDLAPGQVVESTMVALQPLVQIGDLVAVQVRAAGIEVTGRARASEPGRLGAVIRLVNPDSGRALKGRVIGPGKVEVVR